MNALEIPKNVQKALDGLVNKTREYFKDDLVGMYLHGSLAMGGFNPVSSDIDILIVVKNPLSLDQKKELGKMFVDLSEGVPGNGYELSIVTVDAVQNFVYPTPYEFHFSYDQKEAFLQGLIDFSNGAVDPDLAAHFLITKKRGVCLYGQPISEIFKEVPKEYYLDSLMKDAAWSYNKIIETSDDESTLPVYAILNFCRMLALLQVDLVASKLEGGEWALKNLPREYHQIIEEALKEKRESGAGKGLDSKSVKEFARYAMQLIQDTSKELSVLGA